MNIFDIIQTIAGFVLGVFYLPQILRLWKVKTTREISLWGWMVLLAGLSGMLANATHLYLTVGAWSYFVAEIINVFFCLVYVIEVIYIRYFIEGKSKENKKSEKVYK